MSATNLMEDGLLNLIFRNTDLANIGDAGGLRGSVSAGNFYISLHTSDPGEAGSQTTNEAAYTNYARVAVPRGTAGWTAASAGLTENAAEILFPQCGATGATITHFGIGFAATGTGSLNFKGALTASLAVSNGITPRFAIGALDVTLD